MKFTDEDKKVSIVVGAAIWFGILASLFLPSCALAQRRDTVFQQVWSNSTNANRNSSPVENIGQSQHQFYLTIQALNGVGSCDFDAGGGNISFIVEGSTDNFLTDTNAFGENYIVTSAGPGAANDYIVIRAAGIYPYVRIRQASAGLVNCQTDVFYSGSLFPFGTPTEMEPHVGQMKWYCTAAVTTADTNFTIVPAPPIGNVVVYGLVVHDQASREVSIGYIDGTPTFVPIIPEIKMAAGTNYVLANASRPWFSVPGTGFELTLRLLTGASKVTACALARYSTLVPNSHP